MRKPFDVLAEGLSVHQSGGGGNRTSPENSGKTNDSGSRAAFCAARPSGTGENPAQVSTGDPILDRLLAVWPDLTDGDRVALVEHAERLASTANTSDR
jgi:hypothetical protein